MLYGKSYLVIIFMVQVVIEYLLLILYIHNLKSVHGVSIQLSQPLEISCL